MADCELLSRCIFFSGQMASVPAMADLMKDNYCRDNHGGCARYMVFKRFGQERVPQDLYPSDLETANHIIGNQPTGR